MALSFRLFISTGNKQPGLHDQPWDDRNNVDTDWEGAPEPRFNRKKNNQIAEKISPHVDPNSITAKIAQIRLKQRGKTTRAGCPVKRSAPLSIGGN